MQSAASGVASPRADEIGVALAQRASALSKLLLARLSVQISATEAGVIQALSVKPRRVTELAARERVTQPGITLLVNRLQEREWVQRESDSADRRVVLVSLTDEGRRALEELRSQYRALLHEVMSTLAEDDVDALERAVAILDELIERLR